MTSATTDTLRPHVQVLKEAFTSLSAAPLAALEPVYAAFLRRLVRAAHCPELDTLVPALAALEGLRHAVNSAHQSNTVRGFSSLRRAMQGIEDFIENVELAEAGREPIPDEQLDLPQEGFVARMMARLAESQRRPAARAVNVQARRPARGTRRGTDPTAMVRRAVSGLNLGMAA